jgi:uncharacterized beta-barrel protein YwiB (DUF1934 family)
MGTSVMIKVTGSQMGLDGQDRCIEMITTGILTQKGQMYELEYEESELSGMEGTTTKIQFEREFVSLERIGEYPSQMVFAKGKKYVNFFTTPFGHMEMGIYPTYVNTKMSDEEGNINLSYLMDIEGKVQSSNRLLVKYTKQLQRNDLNLDN